MRGRTAMLQAVFGGEKSDTADQAMTPDIFDTVFDL